jgi:hypothetical protein
VDHIAAGGAGDAVLLVDLAQAESAPAIAKDGFAVKLEGLASRLAVFEARPPHAGTHLLDDQVAFKFRDGADNG